MSDDLNKLDYDVSYGADFQERKVEVIDVTRKKMTLQNPGLKMINM